MSLKDDVNDFVARDPMGSLRISCTMMLIQCVGAAVGAGATEEEIRECFEETLQLAVRQLAEATPGETAGQMLDAALRGGRRIIQ